MENETIINRLKELKRYRYEICGGNCDCCGVWVELEEDNNGDLVEWEDIEKIIKELTPTNMK